VGRRLLTGLVAVLFAALVAAEGDAPRIAVQVEVEPREATVGDPLTLRVAVDLPPATRLEPPRLGPEMGPFSVIEGAWSGPEPVAGGERWTWRGSIVTFRPGEAELPGVRIVIEDDAGVSHETESEPVTVTIRSVLDEEESGAAEELADLKPPASVPPDYGPLVGAAGVLAGLLLAAGVLWWLHRRFASRLAAVPAPDDPFHLTPPHEWVYAQLQALLERRLAEQGEMALFFAEVARIVKRYLGGRFRTELMERTTAEVAEPLRQAGADGAAIAAVDELLARCDRVKFARELPPSEACREAIEAAYRIVDATKPRARPVERGVA